MLPKVSVVVPVKNEEKVIENCIKSLLNVNYPKNRIEIVIATDGNTDRTLEICKKYKPKIKVIETKPTHCKAEALNAVIPKLKGEIIAIYDADCTVEKNCIMNAVQRFSDDEIMGVMGFIKPYNKQQNIITRMIFLETILVFFQESIINKFGYNPNFLGKNMFFRKEVLKKIGKFDEYSYSEDIEFSSRLRQHKYKTVLEPTAIAHDECANTITDVLRQGLRFFRGLLRIKRKSSFEDLLHGFNVYLNAESATMLFILLINLLFFKLSSFILFLTLTIVIFQFLFISVSNYFFKQPMENLFLFPVLILLSYISFYSMLKAWYSEKLGKPMKWYRVNRTGKIDRNKKY